jgi:hypothetical protein
MDIASCRSERGNPMSRYIATTLLALAAAVITVAELAITLEQPDYAHAAFVVQP